MNWPGSLGGDWRHVMTQWAIMGPEVDIKARDFVLKWKKLLVLCSCPVRYKYLWDFSFCFIYPHFLKLKPSVSATVSCSGTVCSRYEQTARPEAVCSRYEQTARPEDLCSRYEQTARPEAVYSRYEQTARPEALCSRFEQTARPEEGVNMTHGHLNFKLDFIVFSRWRT